MLTTHVLKFGYKFFFTVQEIHLYRVWDSIEYDFLSIRIQQLLKKYLNYTAHKVQRQNAVVDSKVTNRYNRKTILSGAAKVTSISREVG